MQTKILPAKYIMKTDDDAFVRIDEVLSSLKGKATSGVLYGLIAFQSSPHRDKESKWFVSEEVSFFFEIFSSLICSGIYALPDKGPFHRNGRKIHIHRGLTVQVI